MQEGKQQNNIIDFFLKENILISSDIKEKLGSFSLGFEEKLLEKLKKLEIYDDFLILTGEIVQKIFSDDGLNIEINSLRKIEKQKVEQEKGKRKYIDNTLLENKKDKYEKEVAYKDEKNNGVKILFSYAEKPIKRKVSDFISYFSSRFKSLEEMLKPRKELQNRISIHIAKNKKEKDTVSLIGMVSNISQTKNNNIMIKIEDFTGQINVLINKNCANELFTIGKNIVHDEVIGVVGTASNGIVFANKIIMPDIPLTKEFKKSPYEGYAAFMGDLHFGSNVFLKKEFIRFLNWINGNYGNKKQKEEASKVKYLFIVGDIVDGVGIYPSQEEDLLIPDILDQYREFTKYLKKIPSNIQIIISPGNHDAMRMAEPQPQIYRDFAEELYEMENVHLVSNPSLINIGSKNNFFGFDVLLYHGFSFTYYADNLENIRIKGGLERADLIMEQLLKKRHLAPSHTSTLYVPDSKNDPLVIQKIPDFFVTGHIHRTTAKNFNNITLLNCSCWLGQTPFQEKVGLKPQPARLPIVNLKTREIKILKFGKDTYTLDDNK